MEKEKLIAFITSNLSIDNSEELVEWVKTSDENQEEYIRYKNLWAIMQTGKDMQKHDISDAISKVRKKANRKKQPIKIWNTVKYAAIIVLAVIGGYMIANREYNADVVMNQVYVPNGNRSSVILPDGSNVWISNGTKLIYPEKFTGKNRIVELEGEGFFDVTHDKTHPFIVKIGENRIKVMGTKFALVAYPDDKQVKAELISGKIQFDVRDKNQTDEYQSYLMTPSQRLVVDKSTGVVKKLEVTDVFYKYWLNGIYQFRDESFEELAKKIERIYNVEITFEDEELKDRLFSGSLSINDNIYTLMEVFQRSADGIFSYTSKKNHIYIKRKK